MKRCHGACLVVVLLMAAQGCRGPQGSIQGRVQPADEGDASGITVVLQGSSQTFTTRADGAFLFRDLYPGMYDVVVRADGFQPVTLADLTLETGQRMALQPIVLEPLEPIFEPEISTVEGYVSLLGSPDNAGAVVELLAWDQAEPLVADATFTTELTGGYAFEDVAPGVYTLRAGKVGYATASREQIAVATGELVNVPVLTLSPDSLMPEGIEDRPEVSMLFGRVRLPGTLDFSGVEIVVDERGPSTLSHGDGTYILEEVPRERVTVEFSRDGYRAYRLVVDVTQPQHELRDVLLMRALERTGGGTITGTVLLPGGVPAAGAEVMLLDDLTVVYADDRGRFVLDNASEGRHQVLIALEGFQELDIYGVNVLEFQTTDLGELQLTLDIPFDAPGSLTGLVELEDGGDPRGTLVAIPGTSHLASADAQGRYVLSGIPPGVYAVEAVKQGYETATILEAELPAGMTVELPLLWLGLSQDRPRVVSTLPSHGARRVEVDEFVEVRVVFNQDMNQGTVDQAVTFSPAVTAQSMGPELVPGAGKRVFAYQLRRDGANPLQLRTTYEVMIAPTAANVDNVSMGEPHRFSFTTGGPRIVAVFPHDGANNLTLGPSDYIYIDTNVRVDLDQWRRAITIRGAPGEVIDLFRSRRGHGDRIQLDTSIPGEGRRYSVRINSRARAADGARFDNVPYRWSFSTRGALRGPRGSLHSDQDDDLFNIEDDPYWDN